MKLFRYKSRWLQVLINVIGLGVAFTVFLILMSQVWWDFRYDRFKGGKDVYALEIPSFLEGTYTNQVTRSFLPMVADCSPDIIGYCDYYSFGMARDFSAASRVHGYGVHSSNAITMSDPRSR